MVITGNYMCMAFILLLLENTKLFYTLFLFCIYLEILSISSFFKCLITIKCSESRVETLQIFKIILYIKSRGRIN